MGKNIFAQYRQFAGMDEQRAEDLQHMLDNPDKHEIYPTSTAFTRLEHYVEQQRTEAIGWTHADACIDLDNKVDPRLKNVPEMHSRALVDLA